MNDRLDQLRGQLVDWLRRNELDGDLNFWTQVEWKRRREDYLNGAALVITTEGGLFHLLNYALDHPKLDELQDLLSSFGFWFEMGHAWSIGVYRDEAYQSCPTPSRYEDKLEDPRWKRKAELVKTRAGQRCQDCGAVDQPLEAHHCWYRFGLEPWQYPFDALRCLCRRCHRKCAAVDHGFRSLSAEFTGDELTRIRASVRQLFHWSDRSAALAFLDAVGPDTVAMTQAISLSVRPQDGARSHVEGEDLLVVLVKGTIVPDMGTPGTQDRLAVTLFGKTRRAVLGLLYTHADEAFYLREIARMAGAGLGAVQRDLRALCEATIVRRHTRGRQVYYQANRDCPVFGELKGLIVKTAGAADVIRAALGPLIERIELALIHGSVARGSERTSSDVDVLVVGEVTFAEVVAALQAAQRTLGREVNPAVYPPAEFRAKLGTGNPFLRRVVSGDSIQVIGDPREFAGLAAKRLDR